MRHRRLAGPTIISLALCALLADYSFSSQWSWSASRFLGRALATLAAIFAPPSDPVLNSRISALLLPVLGAALALGLLWFMVGRAKRAMSQATPEVTVNDPVWRRTKAPAISSMGRPRHAAPAPGARQHFGLVRKLVFFIGALASLFGIVICVIVYGFLSQAIERQAKERVDVMVFGLREIIAPALAAGRVNEVAGAVEKYASKNKLTYAYVEDPSGQIVGHWPKDLPRYLRRDFPDSAERALQGMDDEYRGVTVYETARRTGEGESGFVHVAVGRQDIEAEARRVVVLVAAATLLSLLGVVAALLRVARSLERRWTELVERAERISQGDFSASLALQQTDEIGEIARSFERMRSSQIVAAERLEERHRARRSNES